MKNLTLLLLLVISLTSCDKDEVSISNELQGHWKWKANCGGVVGCTYASKTNYGGITIRNAIITKYANSKMISSEHYTIKSFETVESSTVYKLVLDDGTEYDVTVRHNALSFDYYNGGSYYERIPLI